MKKKPTPSVPRPIAVSGAHGASRSWILLAWIITAYIVLAMAMAARVPFGSAPDEVPHIQYVMHLCEQHSLPVLGRGSDAQFEFHQPPLYYVLCAPVYMISNGDDLVVRMPSVLMGALTIWAVWWALGDVLGVKSRLRAPITSAIAFLPMFVFLTASVNNDNLVHLLFAIALGLGAGIVRKGPTIGTVALLGIVAGLGGLTKLVGLILIPIGLIAIWLPTLNNREIRRRALIGSGIFFLIAMLLSGPWLVRNQIIYGDPFAQAAFMKYFGTRNVTMAGMLQSGFTPGGYMALVWKYTSCSLLGVFGHMDLWLPSWMYAIYDVILLIGVIGMMVWYLRQREAAAIATRGAIGLWAASFLLVLLFFIKFNTQFFQAQARYLFPALPAIMAGIVLGATRLVPSKARIYVAWGIAAFLLLVTIYTISGYSDLMQHM